MEILPGYARKNAAKTTMDAALAAFESTGIATLENVFTAPECAEMRAVLDAAIRDAVHGPGQNWRDYSAAEQVVTVATDGQPGGTVFAL